MHNKDIKINFIIYFAVLNVSLNKRNQRRLLLPINSDVFILLNSKTKRRILWFAYIFHYYNTRGVCLFFFFFWILDIQWQHFQLTIDFLLLIKLIRIKICIIFIDMVCTYGNIGGKKLKNYINSKSINYEKKFKIRIYLYTYYKKALVYQN